MVLDFLSKYFVEPLLNNVGYNPVNTAVYAAILVLTVYLVFKILNKLKIRIDERFAMAVSPFVILGSTLRVIADSGIINSFWLVSPLIYIVGFSITFSVLLVSYFLERTARIPYYKTMFILGILFSSYFLARLEISNFYGIFLSFSSLIPWIIIFKIIRWSTENKFVSVIHMFDASNTFVAISFFNYYELHVLPGFLINLFGPFSFVILKAFAVVTILVLLDRYSEDREFNKYLKLIIGILGAATSTRDFLRLAALV